jgi:pilus assembly protein CpaB
MRSRTVLIQYLTIIVLAAITAFGVYTYTAGVESRIKKSYETQELYIATKQIPAGTTLSSAILSDSIESRQFPIVSAPTNSIRTLAGLDQTLVASYTIQPGQILLQDAFGNTGNPTSALVIPNGMLAVTLTVPDGSRVGGFVQPGSQVAIYASGQLNKEDEGNITQVLLPRALVLAVGNQTVASTNTNTGNNNSTLVTVAVSALDAKKVIHASQNLTLYLGLLGTGVQIDFSEPIKNATLFSR